MIFYCKRSICISGRTELQQQPLYITHKPSGIDSTCDTLLQSSTFASPLILLCQAITFLTLPVLQPRVYTQYNSRYSACTGDYFPEKCNVMYFHSPLTKKLKVLIRFPKPTTVILHERSASVTTEAAKCTFMFTCYNDTVIVLRRKMRILICVDYSVVYRLPALLSNQSHLELGNFLAN